MEGKRFQIRTNKKIDIDNKIIWTLKGVGELFINANIGARINARFCEPGKSAVDENAPFYQQAGVLTFLKTSTQLQIWFNDLLEVTWVYKDYGGRCKMKSKMTGLKFKGAGKENNISTHYRYERGNYGYSIIFTKSLPYDAKI